MNSPSRVFSVIPPAVGREYSGNEREQDLDVRTGHRESSSTRPREVQVTGVAEVSSPADRASLRVSVSNSKESVNEATNSVSRRLEYILQTLRCQTGSRKGRVSEGFNSNQAVGSSHFIKQHGIRDEDTSLRRFLHHDADMYRMDAEVMIAFSDFEKMEQICSILLEKLDKSVCVGTPRFYHSPECLSQLRQRACVLAVENAQQKACKVSQLLGQSLGSPLLVREEETKEQRSEEEEEEGGVRERASSRLPYRPTVTASSRVSISFSFRDRSRKKL